MPYELRDLAPAVEYAGRHPEAGFALLRALEAGLRPGFAAIVDEPERATGLMLVHRPDWRGRGPLVTHIQLDAEAAATALRMLAWVPPGAQVRITTYRPWLHDLAQGVLESARTAQYVLCVMEEPQFRGDPRADLAVEIGVDALRRSGELPALEVGDGDRLFGVMRDGRVVSCAALGAPENGYAAVRYLFTQPEERRRGHGTAALAAAVRAGLQAGCKVLCRVPAAELWLLDLVTRLGFSPVCREWSAEGRARR